MKRSPRFRMLGTAVGSMALLIAASCTEQTANPLEPGASALDARGLQREACAADGAVEFVCGPENPEDLAWVPQSPWVIVSTWQDDGYLSAVHFGTREATRIYPSEAPSVRHDTELYGACPGPIHDRFYAHGVSLRPGKNRVHTLFVVRHNAREAIEVFEVDARGNLPQLTWIGCVLPPDGAGLGFNSVIWLPDGGLGVTSPATNDVWEWQPDAGWAQVPGSVGGVPNGLEVSPDGKWYFIGGWGSQELIRLSRGQAVVEKTSIPVGFRIDNVHFDREGRLLAAGHAATVQQVIDCLRNSVCVGMTSKVVRVDTELQHAEEVFSYPTNEYLALGTAAIQAKENEIWVGGLRGERVAIVKAPR